jgi:succinate dehydrogenase hydrophobic anchor subunit
VGFLVIYIALLGVALYHGLYGLRNILYELDPSPGFKRFMGVAILVVGIALMAVGTWAAIAARTTALAAGL